MIKRERKRKEEKKKMNRKRKRREKVKDRETGTRRDSHTVNFWEFFSAPNEKRRALKNIDQWQTKECFSKTLRNM